MTAASASVVGADHAGGGGRAEDGDEGGHAERGTDCRNMVWAPMPVASFCGPADLTAHRPRPHQGDLRQACCRQSARTHGQAVPRPLPADPELRPPLPDRLGADDLPAGDLDGHRGQRTGRRSAQDLAGQRVELRPVTWAVERRTRRRDRAAHVGADRAETPCRRRGGPGDDHRVATGQSGRDRPTDGNVVQRGERVATVALVVASPGRRARDGCAGSGRARLALGRIWPGLATS
jgi:hypothetical protein